ncbi:MAG TPA: AI-2E family transporter [candidate division Zixibacteria bacterium]|nr:AI-2E family transporter [candidate division Zixibacteria bacterium]
MNQTWLVTGFFFALLATILYGAFLILSPFLRAITWAAILAILVYPAYVWLLRKLGGRATAAALIIITLITLLVVLPGIRVAGYLSTEAVELVRSVGSLMSREGVEEWKQKAWVQQLISWWSVLGVELAALDFQFNWKEILIRGAQLSSGALVAHITEVAQDILRFVANFVLVLITLFFFLRDGSAFFQRVRRLLPMDPEHQERLFQHVVNAVSAVVHGCIVVAMVQGLLAGVAYWALGVPYAILWGAVTTLAALFPVGGTTLVTVPASIYLFLEGENVRGFLLLVFSLGVVGVIDNVLKPILIGSRLQLPVLFLFFGILGGLAVFGALGFILGPVVLALLAALLDLYSEEYAAQ